MAVIPFVPPQTALAFNTWLGDLAALRVDHGVRFL
jgi:hypothetical protein